MPLSNERLNVIHRWFKYLGVHEVPDGSNRTPFGVKFGMNGVAWCQESDWVVRHECGVAGIPKSASTMYMVAYARKHGLWHNGLKGILPGDPLYYHWASSSRPKDQPDHVETYLGAITGGAHTIGGNVSNAVRQQNRRASILGYIRWPGMDKTFAAPKPTPKPTPKPVAWKPGDVLHVTGNAWLRRGASLLALPIRRKAGVDKGNAVTFLGGKGTAPKWAQVRTRDGRLGWIMRSKLGR